MMEFDDIVVKENPGLCRCCLSEGCYKDLGSEYTWMNENEVYADMLLECFDISISQINEGPNGPNRLICEVCITRLRDACNFKKQVFECEKKFIDMVARGEFRKVLIYQAHMKSEEVGPEDEIQADESEYLEEDPDFGDDEPLKREEPQPTVSAEPLQIKGKRGRPKKQPDAKPEKKKSNTDDKKTKPVAKDKNSPFEPSTDTPAPGVFLGCTSERRRKNLKIIFNCTTIIPFKWRGRYLCFYCGKPYAEYAELKNHTQSHAPCTTKDYALRIIRGSHVEIKIDVSEIVCKICYEPFDSFEEIVNHLIGKHKLSYEKQIGTPYQEYRLSDCGCTRCGERFAYFTNLVKHVNTAHPQNRFICDKCEMPFNKKRDLAVHFRNYHGEENYNCVQCSQNFKSLVTLRRHQNDIHFRQCKICGNRFESVAVLRKHEVSEHPDDGNYKCRYCCKELHSAPGLRLHYGKCKVRAIASIDPKCPLISGEIRRRKLKNNLKAIRNNIQCVLNMSTAIPFKYFAKYSCFYCTLKFVEFEDLRQHTMLEHPVCDVKEKYMRQCKGDRVCVKIDISSLKCKLCCMPMEDLDLLIDHLISEHKAGYDKSIKGCLDPYRIIKDSIPCPLCETVFRYFSTLQRHINSDHSNNNAICDFCGKSFNKLSNLVVHIGLAHMGATQCGICGANFKNNWCLSRHRAKHHGVKDYKCTKCPELFISSYQMQKHLIKVHNEGHKCVHCGRLFTRNSFMKDHIRRTHLKEKNIACAVCNEKFFDNYLLRLHMVKHDGERKFTCEVCGKAFLRRSNLNCHKEMHKKYGHI